MSFNICHASGEIARQFLTYSVTSRLPITALRKVYSITSSARACSVAGTARPSHLVERRISQHH